MRVSRAIEQVKGCVEIKNSRLDGVAVRFHTG